MIKFSARVWLPGHYRPASVDRLDLVTLIGSVTTTVLDQVVG